MSITLIVIVSTVMASLIGLKIYFEYRQEKQLEKAKQDLEKETKKETHFTQEEALVAHQPVITEEPQESKPKFDLVNPTYAGIENINSEAVLKENKPKTKKKRYYPSKSKKSQNKKIK